MPTFLRACGSSERWSPVLTCVQLIDSIQAAIQQWHQLVGASELQVAHALVRTCIRQAAPVQSRIAAEGLAEYLGKHNNCHHLGQLAAVLAA
jgi:hypothetical protein